MGAYYYLYKYADRFSKLVGQGKIKNLYSDKTIEYLKGVLDRVLKKFPKAQEEITMAFAKPPEIPFGDSSIYVFDPSQFNYITKQIARGKGTLETVLPAAAQMAEKAHGIKAGVTSEDIEKIKRFRHVIPILPYLPKKIRRRILIGDIPSELPIPKSIKEKIFVRDAMPILPTNPKEAKTLRKIMEPEDLYGDKDLFNRFMLAHERIEQLAGQHIAQLIQPGDAEEVIISRFSKLPFSRQIANIASKIVPQKYAKNAEKIRAIMNLLLDSHYSPEVLLREQRLWAKIRPFEKLTEIQDIKQFL
jgi:hypothetical protein